MKHKMFCAFIAVGLLHVSMEANNSRPDTSRWEASIGISYPAGMHAKVSYWQTPNCRLSIIINAYPEPSSNPKLSPSMEAIVFYRMAVWKFLSCGLESGIGLYLLSSDKANSLEPGIPFRAIGELWLGKDWGIHIKLPVYFMLRDFNLYRPSTSTIGFCRKINF